MAPNPPPAFMAKPTAAKGFTQWSLFLPPTIAVEVWVQPFVLHVAFHAGGTAPLVIK